MALLILLPGREIALDARALDDIAHTLWEELLGVEARSKTVLSLEGDDREEAAELFTEAEADDTEGEPGHEIRGVSTGRCGVLTHRIPGATRISRDDEGDDLALARGGDIAREANARIAERAGDRDGHVFIAARVEIMNGLDKDGRAERLVFAVEAQPARDDLKGFSEHGKAPFFEAHCAAHSERIFNQIDDEIGAERGVEIGTLDLEAPVGVHAEREIESCAVIIFGALFA